MNNNSTKTSKHKAALLQAFEWREGAERNRGLVKEIAQVLGNACFSTVCQWGFTG